MSATPMKLKCPNCKSNDLVGLMGSVWVTLDEHGDFSGSFADYESSTDLTEERGCSACGYEWTLGSAEARPKKFALGDLVRKIKGSEWDGRIVGTYSTALTPDGYCVESSAHSGSVQIYPAAALEIVE